jgi:magnesium-transporting ATPase (P-type)
VRQILAIDLGTDLLPAVALGIEKPEPDVMNRPPRAHNQPLIDNWLLIRAFLWLGLIEAVLCYIGFFSVYVFSGNSALLGIPLLAQIPVPPFLQLSLTKEVTELMAVTVFHAGVVMSQVGNAFACRSEATRGRYLGWGSNKYLLIAVVGEVLGILFLIYWPPIAPHFEHVPIPLFYWVGLSMFSLIVYSLEWIRKRIVRGLRSRHAAPPALASGASVADGSQEKSETSS